MSESNPIPSITALSLNDVNRNIEPPPVFFVIVEIERLLRMSESEHSSFKKIREVEENMKGASLNGRERSAVMTEDDVKERLKKEVLAHSRESPDVSESKGDVRKRCAFRPS